MEISRRDLLIAGGLSLMTSAIARGQAAAPPNQTAPPQASLLRALQNNRLPIALGETPSGDGWDWLVSQARDARFTLIGEEIGVAETAQFSTDLFNSLSSSGYSRVAVGLSPAMAVDIEAAARRNGPKGIVDLLKNPGAFTFYNLREEAKFLSDVVAAAPRNGRFLWGLDREVFSDRYLISRLESKVPPGARPAFGRLKQASVNAWARFEQTRNPDDMFILAEDPALVAAVRAAWPNPDRTSAVILHTLEEALAIETVERTAGRWPYFQRRTQSTRSNFAAMIKAEETRKVRPKILMKIGYNQAIRGANYLNLFEVGAMADEVAALTGEQVLTFSSFPAPIPARPSQVQVELSVRSRPPTTTASKAATVASPACFRMRMPQVMR